MLIQSASCGKNTSTHFGLAIFCQGCIVQTFFFFFANSKECVMSGPCFLYFLYKDIAINLLIFFTHNFYLSLHSSSINARVSFYLLYLLKDLEYCLL